jgi:hypothetical protein
MKTYGGSGDVAPPFPALTLDGGEWSASRFGSFTSGESQTVPTELEAWWAPKTVWML